MKERSGPTVCPKNLPSSTSCYSEFDSFEHRNLGERGLGTSWRTRQIEGDLPEVDSLIAWRMLRREDRERDAVEDGEMVDAAR